LKINDFKKTFLLPCGRRRLLKIEMDRSTGEVKSETLAACRKAAAKTSTTRLKAATATATAAGSYWVVACSI